jgi:hypothetical protein
MSSLPPAPDPHPQLGALLRSSQTIQKPLAPRVLGVLLLLAGLGTCGGGGLLVLILPLSQAAQPRPNAVGAALGMLLVLACTAPAGALLLWLARGRFRAASAGERQARLAIHERGLEHLEGEALTTIAWEEVEAFYRPPTRAPIYGVGVDMPYMFFTVQARGRKLELRGFPQLKEMGELVERERNGRLLAEARQKLAAGQTLRFGAITLSPQGIDGFSLVGGREDWKDVQGLYNGKHNRLCLSVRLNPFPLLGPFFIETPDPTVLFTLVHELKGR